jgi:Kef-type K+ transport system membrane component KefB
MQFGFLPSWPFEANNLILFGAILLAGLVAGELAHRSGVVPRITGFIVIGLLLGPDVTGWLTPGMLAQSQVFVDIALGLILFQLGLQLDFRAIRRDRSLLVSGLVEAALSYGLMYAVLVWLGIDRLHAALAAALGISSSPAVVLLVVRELAASGPLTERSLNLVALNNVLAFLVFTALLPILHYEQQAEWGTILLQPLYQLTGSLLLAYVLWQVCMRILILIGSNESRQFALLIGVIVSAIGLAKLFQVSSLLTLLALGIMARNMGRKRDLLPVEFGHGGEIFFVILFVIAGANLHLHELAAVGWAAAAFVAARVAGKTLGLLAVSRLGQFSLFQSSMLSLTLVPMAGLAIGLTQTTSAMYPEFAQTLSAIILAAVAILESIGPIVTEFALKRSGEVSKDSKVEH